MTVMQPYGRRLYLIVDGNNVSWRGTAVMPRERLLQEPDCGLLWGMVRKRVRTSKAAGWEEVIPVFTFDAPHDPLIKSDARFNRYSIETDYKANRTIDKEDTAKLELEHARALWRDKWISEVEDYGNISVSYPGVEADDLMAYIASATADGDKAGAAIWTTDKDLLQCVDDDNGILVYRKVRKIEKAMHEVDVVESKGVPPSKVRMQLALQGDAADNYAKIPGYGGKRGMKLLTESSSINDIIEALPDFKDRIIENWELAGVGANYMPSGAINAADFAIERALSAKDEDA